MRVIARRERPHPGAQLRLTDADGWRITLFATNVRDGRIAELELTHRLRARAEDRIRCLKDTSLNNLPLHNFTANQICMELTALAADLLAWTQHLALTGTPARCWEPKRLRLRLLSVAGRAPATGAAKPGDRDPQRRRPPPERLVRQPPAHRVTRHSLSSAAAAPPVELTRLDPTGQHRTIRFEPLNHHLQTELVEACRTRRDQAARR